MGEGVRAEGLHELYLRSESRLGTLRRTQVLGADPQDDLLPGEPREAAARQRQAYPARERSGGAVRCDLRRQEVHRRRADEAGHEEAGRVTVDRSEEHTSELQSLMRNSYAVFSLKK